MFFITTNIPIQAAQWATNQVGCKYSQAKRTQDGIFDCSSLVARAYSACGKKWKYGGSVPLSNQEVYDDDFELIWPASYADIGVTKGKRDVIAMATQPGDLQFLCTNTKTSRSNKITHVAMVNSKDTIVHARSTKYGVCENDINLYAGKVCAVTRYNPTCVLRFGMKGFRTLAIQQALNSKGFNLEEDSDFGSKTEAAVREFQKAEGLISSGEVGQLTAALLGLTWSASKVTDNALQASSTNTVEITGNCVNVRCGPGKEYSSLAIAKRGDIFEHVNTDGWHPIIFNGKVRWVSDNYSKVNITNE